ncbi:MAG: DNA primase [bacterium]|nr:DNA primase [bacterium]
MPNPSDEIKAKLDIVEVIREYIPLKAAGFNFRANCPFHREKTPSFMVSPEKQIWHCFGCGKGGDVFSFVMEIESLTFIEVLRLLAKKAGVTLKRGADPALTSKRNVLLDIVELSAKFYHKVLLASPAAAVAREYLKKRGLIEETIETWQIGYSPDTWETLTNFLKSKNFSENEIFLAGLSVKKEKNPGFYDRFRGRIMFPINDINGNAVGFTARVNPEKEATEKMGKYINTPATMIYEKSKILFGLDKAKMSIKSEDAVVLVEGQMDAITAQQNGFINVVASSGTALTSDQVSLIKRYSNNLLLSFDMDKAGDLASERGIAQAMQAEMQIKVIEIKDAKDPDECIKKNPDGWRQAVAAAKPVMQYYFDKTFAKFNIKDFDGQRQSINILLPVISKFGSKIEQDFWLKKLSQEVDTNESLLRAEFNKIVERMEQKLKTPILSVKPDDRQKFEFKDQKQSRESRLSELLLALGLKYPAHLEYIINHIAPEHLVGDDYKLFYKNLIIYYNKLIDFWTHEGGDFDLAINYQDLKNWFNNLEDLEQDDKNEVNNRENNHKYASLLDKLVLLADKDFYDYTPEKARAEMIEWVGILKVNYLSDRRRQIIKLIVLAEKEILEPQEKAEKLTTLMQEYKALTEEINLIGLK